MGTEILPVGPALFPALHRFSEQTWRRPRSAAFLDWRYARCPSLSGYAAVRDGECLATVTGFARPYRIGDVVVEVRESFDWYCLPDLRRSGLGVRVLQRLMQDAQPLTVIGGSDDTRNLLPRLGFTIPGELASFVLPLGAERVSQVLRDKARVPTRLTRAAFALARPLLAPRRRRAPRGLRAIPVACAGPEIEALYARATYGTFPMWTADHLRWLAGFPGAGQFATVYFAEGEALRGFGILRVHAAPEGRVARILDVFAPEPDADLFAWMVSELCQIAAAYRPDYVTAQTTCPELARALAGNRFRRGEGQPIHFFSRDKVVPPPPLFFGGNWGDAALLPYPESWFEGGA